MNISAEEADGKEEAGMKGKGKFFAGLGVGIALTLTTTFGTRFVFETAERITAAVTGSPAGVRSAMDGSKREVWSKLGVLSGLIDHSFLFEDEVDTGTMKENIYKGYVAGLGDPYSEYFDKKETEDFMTMTSGEYSGIGAVLSQDVKTGSAVILETYDGSPSQKAGLHTGDILLKADGHETMGLSLTEIVSYIKGQEGSDVTVEVLRGEEKLSFTMKREKIQVQTVKHQMMDDGTGYMQITEFEGVTYDQFVEAMDDLEAQQMERLVIDLRNNPGGDLDVVTDILGRLLPEGVIVSIKDKQGRTQEYKSDGTHEFKKPLAVLVNGNSASASEIFAGAVQDYGTGVIVGETTFGKGIVQQTYDLKDGTMVKLTIAQYFTPKGRYIHKKGIVPDVEITPRDGAESLENGQDQRDVQLDKALEIVREK